MYIRGWPYVILYRFMGKVWYLLLPYSSQKKVDAYILLLHNLRSAALKQNKTEKPRVCMRLSCPPKPNPHIKFQQQQQTTKKRKPRSTSTNHLQKKPKPWRRVHTSFVGKAPVLLHFLLPYSPQRTADFLLIPLTVRQSVDHDLQHWSLVTLPWEDENNGEIIYALRQ